MHLLRSTGHGGDRPRHKCRALLGIFIGVACVSDALIAAPPAQSDAAIPAPIVFTQAPVTNDSAESISGGWHATPFKAGSRIARVDWGRGESNVVELTREFESAARPRLSFDAKRMLFVGRQNRSDRFGVWEIELAGGQPRAIVQCDGECLEAEYLTTMYTLDGPPTPRIAVARIVTEMRVPSIFTCNLDGTDKSQVTYSPLGASEPFGLHDGRLLFGIPSPSMLQMADIRGPDLKWFTVGIDGSDLRVFLGPGLSAGDRSHTSIKHFDRMGKFAVKGLKLPWRTYWQERLLESRQSNETRTYGLFATDPTTSISELVYDSADWDELDPVAVSPSPPPEGFSSELNHSLNTGQIYCLDAYISDVPTPRDPAIQSVRVLTTSLARSPNEPSGVAEAITTDTLLGTAKVESDGSFYIGVPSGIPLRFESVAADGRVLRSMSSWMWVMPGEHRGCVGCHEDARRTPPNRHVLALRRPAENLASPETLGRAVSAPAQAKDRP